MREYSLQIAKMNQMLERLSRVLDLRITFYDLHEREVKAFNIKARSAFCRYSRLNSPAFKEACAQCDTAHLATAKRQGKIFIYHCHAGLFEGIVPLYDGRSKYLGSIMFGQLSDEARKGGRAIDAKAEELLALNAAASRKKMHDIGALLKYASEYIVENEIVQSCEKPWAETVDKFINGNINGRITLSRLAEEIGRSTSFLSHNFPLEFGMPLKEYVFKAKMEKAGKLLRSGMSVRETAFELGFYDEFHFSKTFKRFFKIPPSVYRRDGGARPPS
jgi:AraC-like DNA-binding protein/ligand-binding sensor protein